MNTAENFCAAHTLSNAGKQATLVANYAEDFRKKFQKVIQYLGKLRDLRTDVFDETIMDADGVKLFVKYEQCCQIATHSPKKSWRKFYPCATKTNGRKS